MPSSWAQLLDRLAVGAVADQAERGLDAAVAQRLKAARMSGTRLIAVMRPIQPTTNRSSGHAEQAPELGAPV